MSSLNIKKIFGFFHLAEKLKTTFRYSETKGVRQESSAEHSWRLALMALVIAKELNLDINLEKALKIALIHDLAEVVSGDVDFTLIVKRKISPAEKLKRETQAMEKIKKFLPIKSRD